MIRRRIEHSDRVISVRHFVVKHVVLVPGLTASQVASCLNSFGPASGVRGRGMCRIASRRGSRTLRDGLVPANCSIRPWPCCSSLRPGLGFVFVRRQPKQFFVCQELAPHVGLNHSVAVLGEHRPNLDGSYTLTPTTSDKADCSRAAPSAAVPIGSCRTLARAEPEAIALGYRGPSRILAVERGQDFAYLADQPQRMLHRDQLFQVSSPVSVSEPASNPPTIHKNVLAYQDVFSAACWAE